MRKKAARPLSSFASGTDLVAPDLVLVEAANAFWAMVRGSRLLEIHAEDNLRCLPDFFRRLWPSGELLERAPRMSFRLRHPVYDCVYLALAERLDVPLITADQRLFGKLAGPTGFPEVHLLGTSTK